MRFTVSWPNCALDPSSPDPAKIDLDLDLFLYNSATKTYVYGSQSVYDNNEGFDVLISSAEQDGTYVVFVSRPYGDANGHATDCGSSSLEIAWAGRWGAPW